MVDQIWLKSQWTFGVKLNFSSSRDYLMQTSKIFRNFDNLAIILKIFNFLHTFSQMLNFMPLAFVSELPVVARLYHNGLWKLIYVRVGAAGEGKCSSSVEPIKRPPSQKKVHLTIFVRTIFLLYPKTKNEISWLRLSRYYIL